MLWLINIKLKLKRFFVFEDVRGINREIVVEKLYKEKEYI